ncbi:hypothetical protein CYMTET_53293 [Cymbomonas tetramitiformis]|uniref:Uncharacterized protein n=1 Tax=Cymbomonas tetramitiformis TaxID=36881 RepID=A0AAE0BID0_9CHLO|nr:hypothetical protein CYMTET_53293 [Cymbomonas tetramitiformis]
MRTLQRDHFDIKMANCVQRKLFNDKEQRFAGNEAHGTALFTKLLIALREAFVTKDSALSTLFSLDDAAVTVRVKSNQLLFSTIELLVHPTSPAAD